MERYLTRQITSGLVIWRANNKVRTMSAGLTLRIETFAPALVHWGIDGWHTAHDVQTRDTTIGVYFADLPTSELRVGSRVNFTLYWPQEDRWEGTDFCVDVE